MSSLAFAEQHTPVSVPEIALNDAAAARGISLEPDRLLQLARAAESVRSFDHYPEKPEIIFTDMANDVTVSSTTFSDRFGATAARVDFAPIVDRGGDEISGATSAHPEHTTRFALMAVHGMQNYVLLADAGIIEKPTVLFGDTNPEMAIVAARVGMISDIARQNSDNQNAAHKRMRQTPKMEVYGNFDDVSERLFSEDTKRLERILTRRLAAEQQVGRVATDSH